jgi:23S rRNA (guanosine2251-2'-O)-methyltransferase
VHIYTSNPKKVAEYLEANQIPLDPAILEFRSNRELTEMLGRDVNHQGCVARLGKNRVMDFHDFVAEECNGKSLPPLLLLDELTDLHNVGAIVRTAVAFGVNYVIKTKYNSPKDPSLILKTSAGTSELVNIIEIVNMSRTIEILKRAGYVVIGLSEKAEKSLKNVKNMSNLCLVVGSEGNGLRRLVRENCTELCRIEMRGEVESLNASVAAAIAIYELWGSK